MSTPHKAFLIFASGPHLIVNQRHGLVDKPLFTDMADEFLAFVGDAPFVAHNASFDIAFINAELARAWPSHRSLPSAWLTPRCWHGASTRADTTRSTTARALSMIVLVARNTARCPTPNCWPRST